MRSASTGEISLNRLRVNQLQLSRQLSGSLEASKHGLEIHVRGLRPDEALDVEASLVLF